MSDTLAGADLQPVEGTDHAPDATAVPSDHVDAVAMPVAEPLEARETVSCPECGLSASVVLNRRQARDFCRNCDFPLFWTPSRVVRDEAAISDESLRRLPGTAGRITVASVACPHCAEANPLTAQTCVRCGRLLRESQRAPRHVKAEAPAPAPAERRTPWWQWALLTLTLAVLVAMVTYLVLR